LRSEGRTILLCFRWFPANLSLGIERRYHFALGVGMIKILRMLHSSPVQLGPLEQQLLTTLWSRGNATVRELLDDGSVQLAYTTVMTTLDRLYKKQLLDRVAEGRAFRYTPRHTKEQLEREVAGETIRQLLGTGPTTLLPLSYLVEAVSDHDVNLLDELQELLDRKRRELRGQEKR
jgi:predicted transcriptional regulator